MVYGGCDPNYSITSGDDCLAVTYQEDRLLTPTCQTLMSMA